jgi:phosphopantothenoylcysteine decarboxylase/phosphopantothenate--cysteine ligase
MSSVDFTGELTGRRVVLGLSGGAACFKAAELCRLLIKAGATVQVVMTEAACRFITPVTMQALSGRPVLVSQWDDREPNNMAHINLTREADAIIVTPASADFIAQLAQGRAGELLALLCLARPMARVPLLIAPSMNREMWAHPATQRNLHQVARDGANVLGVGDGEQACGEVGEGRMLEPEELMGELIACFTPQSLIGQRVVITAGPTFEAIDPVRGLTNLSSGKMGFAIASAACEAGADVTLIAGTVARATPRGVERVDVVSALDMQTAVVSAVADADIFISAAAVADWRPADLAEQKLKKDGSGHVPHLTFVENPDILSGVAHSPRAQAGDLFCVGFAAETENLRANAQAKRARKGVPLLVANIGPATFGRDDNALLLVDDEGETELPRASKRALARQLITEIARRVSGVDA